MLSCISQRGCRILPQDNLLHFVDNLGRPNSLCFERKGGVGGARVEVWGGNQGRGGTGNFSQDVK